jgi:hypothetical protein
MGIPRERWMLLDYPWASYAVSNLGFVKNVRSDRLLKRVEAPTGYLLVGLCTTLNGKRFPKTFRVHRLVAMAFIQNRYCKPYVHHIDSDRQNNVVTNLEWVTAKENDNYSRLCGKKREQNRPIIATHIESGECMAFESLSACGRYLCCNTSYIHRALNGTYNRKSYKGYTFVYAENIMQGD